MAFYDSGRLQRVVVEWLNKGPAGVTLSVQISMNNDILILVVGSCKNTTLSLIPSFSIKYTCEDIFLYVTLGYNLLFRLELFPDDSFLVLSQKVMASYQVT